MRHGRRGTIAGRPAWLAVVGAIGLFLYNTNHAVTATFSSESIANWNADSGQTWTIPIIAQVSKVSTFGPFPAGYGIGAGS